MTGEHMKVKDPVRGGIVQSVQGRDKGSLYVICAVEGQTLFLADGRVRTCQNPKRKNIKHVNLINKNVADYGVEYPWDNSFDVKVAYVLKQIGAELPPKAQSED